MSIGNPIAASDRRLRLSRPIVISVLAHILLFAAFAFQLHHNSAWIAPYRLPGSERGHNFILAYLPDRAPEQSATSKAKPEPKAAIAKIPLLTPPTQKARPVTPASTNTTPSPQPDSTTGADARGSGNITIALTAFFPPPHPDLSTLPHGTRGDVILRVVIDADGKIADMKMLTGLGHGVDETVLATVQGWTFHPALQNGHPVASEQELHFHYEHA